MKFGTVFRSGVAAAAMLLVTSAAQATTVTFFGETPNANSTFPGSAADPSRYAEGLFQSAMSVLKTETFENSAAQFLALNGNSMSVLNGGTLTQAPGIPFDPDFNTPIFFKGVEVKAASTALEGRFNTTGGAARGGWVESDTTFTVNLGIAGGVGGFGFYGTDFGDFAGDLQIELFLDGNSVVGNAFTNDQNVVIDPQATSSSANGGSLLFFGWASTTVKFDRIDFKVGQSSGLRDVLGFDDLMVGNLKAGVTPPPNPAPEPGSLALAGLALVAAGWARKTQRRA